MGAADAGHEFFWSAQAEPHARRRREILAKYGEQVRALYGYDVSTAVQVVCVMVFQIAMAYAVSGLPWWKVLLAAYAIGGVANQNLLTAQHELSHFLAFRTPVYNRVLSLLSNCPIAVPMATAFRKYHQEHHSHLGVDGWDVDLPSYLEANWITALGGKILWVSAYMAIYGLRPVIMRPKPIGVADVVNLALVLGFDAGVLYFWGAKALLYLVLGSLMGGGLHPMAGHLIAEHYMFCKGQETYSYYGPLNALTYNVGLHNEHHDFPQIPHTRLHKLREIAPEYYNELAFHTSWTWVIWHFLIDPDMGPWTRLRRPSRDGSTSDPVLAAKLAANQLAQPPAAQPQTAQWGVAAEPLRAAPQTPSAWGAALAQLSKAGSPGVVTRSAANKMLKAS